MKKLQMFYTQAGLTFEGHPLDASKVQIKGLDSYVKQMAKVGVVTDVIVKEVDVLDREED